MQFIEDICLEKKFRKTGKNILFGFLLKTAFQVLRVISLVIFGFYGTDESFLSTCEETLQFLVGSS